jgi:hypothetical protein
MWLINVKTYGLHEFFGDHLLNIQYAILSHRWDLEEVSFQEMRSLDDRCRAKKGFAKIRYTLNQAKEHGLDWAWVDTCCIDKTSSSELSESINSMYLWYQRSHICYVYMSDVEGVANGEWTNREWSTSKWFTRGWTLQELIAPACIIFYNSYWHRIGEKIKFPRYTANGDTTLRVWDVAERYMLSSVSNIPYNLLFGLGGDKNDYSVAQRMSWAAKRQCTRIEDVAYSLMGLFDINMPLLYGEERKAFTRLQKEIIENIDDHTLFAWTVPEWEKNIATWTPQPILAASPSFFANSENLVSTHEETGEISSMTKQGLKIQLPITTCHLLSHAPLFFKVGKRELYRVRLSCGIGEDRVDVLLLRDISTQSPGLSDRYFRIATSEHILEKSFTVRADESLIPRTMFIRNKCPETQFGYCLKRESIWLQNIHTAIRNLNRVARGSFTNSNIPASPIAISTAAISIQPSPTSQAKDMDQLITVYTVVEIDSYRESRWVDTIDAVHDFDDLVVFLLESTIGYDPVALVCGRRDPGLCIDLVRFDTLTSLGDIRSNYLKWWGWRGFAPRPAFEVPGTSLVHLDTVNSVATAKLTFSSTMSLSATIKKLDPTYAKHDWSAVVLFRVHVEEDQCRSMI